MNRWARPIYWCEKQRRSYEDRSGAPVPNLLSVDNLHPNSMAESPLPSGILSDAYLPRLIDTVGTEVVPCSVGNYNEHTDDDRCLTEKVFITAVLY